MIGPFFVDTNVLLYADDNDEPEKRDRSRELIRQLLAEKTGKISIQVLQEFFAAGTRKLGLSAVAARRSRVFSCDPRPGGRRNSPDRDRYLSPNSRYGPDSNGPT